MQHRQLLQDAVRLFVPQAECLRNASICVTGASGFLASSLVAFLSELDRIADLRLRLYASARRPLADVSLFSFLELTPKVVWAQAAVEESILPEVEDLIVVHTASYGSPRDYLKQPLATFSANTQGLIALLSQSRKFRQFVYFSSAEVYGQPSDEHIPTPETYIGGSDTLDARAIYAESKRMAEVLGVCLTEKQNVPFTVIRPWNVYGPGQRLDDGRVPMEFVRQAMQQSRIRLASDGSPRRSFCYVWDAILQVVAALCCSDRRSVFNVGNGAEEASVLELAYVCAAVCGISSSCVEFDPNAKPGGLRRCAPNVCAISGRLASAPSFTPLKIGVQTLVEWYRFVSGL